MLTKEELYVSITQSHAVQREAGERGTMRNKVQLLTLQGLLCFSLLHVAEVLLGWCDFIKDRKLPPSQNRKKNKVGDEQGTVMETRTVLSHGNGENMKYPNDFPEISGEQWLCAKMVPLVM